jgi:hypothetical protein
VNNLENELSKFQESMGVNKQMDNANDQHIIDNDDLFFAQNNNNDDGWGEEWSEHPSEEEEEKLDTGFQSLKQKKIDENMNDSDLHYMKEDEKKDDVSTFARDIKSQKNEEDGHNDMKDDEQEEDKRRTKI